MAGESRTTDGLQPLLERDRELDALSAAFGAARRGEGSTVVITGAAGVGKSAVLAAATRRALDRGVAVRHSRGSELEQELSFGVVRQLFEPLLRSVSTAERDWFLSGAAAPAARLFADAALDHAAGGDGGFATLHGLYWLAAGIAAERPLVLVVDDAHWSDLPSLRALNYLAARIGELPAVLVLALRPHEPVPAADLLAALETAPATVRLELSALGGRAVAEVIRAVIPNAADEVCAACHEASAGNAFLLHELLRSVTAPDGSLPGRDEIRQAAVSSVGDRVMARLAAVGPHAPHLAAAMSVLGSGGRLCDAAAVAGRSEQESAGDARAMRRVEILASEDPFEWIHPLVRRSIYDNLTVVERDALHDRAARVLADAGAPPGIVAAQLSARRPAGSAEVVAALTTAADDALARDAPEVAVSLLGRALEEGASHPPRASLLLRLGQVEVTSRDPAATEHLRAARELSPDSRERTRAALALAEILTFDGQWEESITTIATAIDDLGDADPALALELEVVRAVICAFDPDLADDLWRDRERLLALARGSSWPARALAAMLAMSAAMRGEHLDEVLPLCELARGEGVLFGERGAGAWASSHVLNALTSMDYLDQSLVCAGELAEAARAQGSIANAVAAEGHRGWIAARRGNLATAEEILRPLVDLALATDMRLILVIALWWLADVIRERDVREELEVLVEELELPPALLEAAGGAWFLMVRGELRAMRGDRAEAEADLRAAGGIFRRLGFGPVHQPWRSTLALSLPPEGAAEARALIDEELALADGTGLSRPRGIALRGAGLLAGGEPGLELLRQSVAVLVKSPARYEHARSLVELGAALRRAGRRAEAREPLEAGRELAHLCGADRLAGRARTELLAAGARPRRIVRSGFAALTASERRVARLAAEGRSNPEIAQALYVSIKTVETHLSSAYRKLHLSGPGARRGLPSLIADTALP